MIDSKSGDYSAVYIGLRIKALRLALGYEKSSDFAESYGASVQQHSNYERGRHPPNVRPMMSLCDRHRIEALEWIYRGIPRALQYDLATEILAEYKRLVAEADLAEDATE